MRNIDRLITIQLSLILAVLILFLFMFWERLGKLTPGNVISIFALMLVIYGWKVGWTKSKKEISVNEKLKVYKRLLELNWELVQEYIKLPSLFISENIKESIGDVSAKIDRNRALLTNSNFMDVLREYDYYINRYLFLVIPSKREHVKRGIKELFNVGSELFLTDMQKFYYFEEGPAFVRQEINLLELRKRIEEIEDRRVVFSNSQDIFIGMLEGALTGDLLSSQYTPDYEVENLREGQMHETMGTDGKIKNIPYHLTLHQKEKMNYEKK